ncbi:uncharacterized protein N0V89_001756 [Didymosphaeria variabile]|uniref:Uncharacterized protein n=1 Tax=Didymosphaeria variabile TaxID=1932322 RepID=A0A9W8XQU8_9PLEO|nr:uncharacterized protein N0V89_001756 [Didymosphaeria variabile]KAJ4357181.1 hypothetical protein N0V89_001756 [Didymosphaeria variabile]
MGSSATKVSGPEQRPAEQEQRVKTDETQAIADQIASVSQGRLKSTDVEDMQDNAAPFRFFDLPAELRCLVYDELLVVGKVYYKDTGYLEAQNTVRFEDKKYFREPYLAILRTCKTVHAEAEKVYLSKNLFVLPLRWQLYSPFVCCENKLNSRSLFSRRGLSYVRNLSIAVDSAKTLDNENESMSYDAYGWRNADHHDYDTMTQTQRFEVTHNKMIAEMYGDGIATSCELLKLQRSSSNLSVQYVEMDWTNAYCRFGCCRPLRAFPYTWICYLTPTVIYNIGTRSLHEEEAIEQCICYNLEAEAEELDEWGCNDIDQSALDKCVIFFVGSQPVDYWNQWKYETEQRKVDFQHSPRH